MNNFKKRLIALVALTCVALSAFASCSDNKDDADSSSKSSNKSESSEVSEEPMTAMPFKWGSASENDITMDGVDINEDDPVKADHVDPTKATESSDESSSAESTTEYVAGEPITEIVTVTEANGEVATEANGEAVTEVKTITNATPEPTKNDNQDNNSTEATTNTEYISNTKGMYAMWIDISKNENFVFNGSVVKVTFKVKENAPDGVYDISINPDLSSIEGVTITPDTIELSINMKDNPGLAAFCIWYYYDSNALEIVDCYPDGEFSEVSKNSTQTGE